jgi:hypothetical protein
MADNVYGDIIDKLQQENKMLREEIQKLKGKSSRGKIPKFKINEKVNTPRGPGTVVDYSTQKVRVGGWDGHNKEVTTYHVVLNGDTHHRPFGEDEIFRLVDRRKK